MVSIGKVKAAQASYHQQQIANGRDDYYAGKGEAPGSWAGAMAAEFGVAGTIGKEGHEALVGGVNPTTGSSSPGAARTRRCWPTTSPSARRRACRCYSPSPTTRPPGRWWKRTTRQ